MTDETTGAEPKIISASFADPYVLLVRDDASVMILEADESGDLDEVERGDDLLTTNWLSGSLYEDADDSFRLGPDDGTEDDTVNVLMFLLSAEGGLYVRDDLARTLSVLGLALISFARYSTFQILPSQSTSLPASASFHHSFQKSSQSGGRRLEIP